VNLEKRWQKTFSARARQFTAPYLISHWTSRGYNLRLKVIGREIQAISAPTDRVLDIGSGPGYYADLFIRPVLLDYSPEVFSRSPSSAKEAYPICGAMQHLPFRAASFDGLICIGALQCLRLTRQDVEGLSRVLKPGGFFAIETLNAECTSMLEEITPDQKKILQKFVATPDPEKPYQVIDDFVVYQAERLMGWFNDAGLLCKKMRFIYADHTMDRAKETLQIIKGTDMQLRNETRSLYFLGQKE